MRQMDVATKDDWDNIMNVWEVKKLLAEKLNLTIIHRKVNIQNWLRLNEIHFNKICTILDCF